MTLMGRITRLFRADIHDLLDRIEEPSLVVRQAIREMEQELNLEEQSIRQLERDCERLTSRHLEIETSLQEIEDQLDVCFDSQMDDLARRVIRRRLEAQTLSRQMTRRRNQNEEALARRKARLQESHERLEELRRKADLLAEEGPDQGPHEEPVICPGTAVRDEDVEVAFLKEKQIRRRS
jgi:phage shock protein A